MKKLVIFEPLIFFSQADEQAFFFGLKYIQAIRKVHRLPGKPMEDIPNELVLELRQGKLDDASLYELIGLMYRYSLDMTGLAQFCTKKNSVYLKDKQKYWYKAIFGAKPKRTSRYKAATGKRIRSVDGNLTKGFR